MKQLFNLLICILLLQTFYTNAQTDTGMSQLILRSETSGIQQLKKNYDTLTKSMDTKMKLQSKSTKDQYNYYKDNFDQSYKRALYLEQQITDNPSDYRFSQQLQATHMDLQRSYDALQNFKYQ